jgi:tetratricopeptide (TPR) repeat protein
LEVEERTGDLPAGAEASLQLGRLALARGDVGEAENWLQRALRHQQALGDVSGQARTYTSLSWLANQQGESRAAESFAQTALTLADRAELREVSIEALRNMAVVAQKRGDLDRALEFYQSALNRIGDSDKSAVAGTLYLEIAQLLTSTERIPAGIQANLQALVRSISTRSEGQIHASIELFKRQRISIGDKEFEDMLNKMLDKENASILMNATAPK